MNPWQKEFLNLQVGDWIIWRDREIKIQDGAVFIAPGMRGKVMSLRDGFHMDLVKGGSVPPKAIVQFENGMTLVVVGEVRWKTIDGSG